MQVAYKEISKDLVPSRIFPSDTEYRTALESYLAQHASHYIEDLGRNSWISMFEEKLLPEVREIFDSYQKNESATFLMSYKTVQSADRRSCMKFIYLLD